ncbi:MAG TPA: hypothetical protein HA362_00835 [Nanoarchaeota archaeon]|nr:hypothetical protein [Nanoarchaeota archaeon]
MPKKRLKTGIFSFTCCEGCTVTFIELLNKKFFEYREKMGICSFRVLKSSPKLCKMDLAIIEGAISTESERKKLLKIRKNAKKVMAIGSCAVTGMPSSQRNSFSKELKKQIWPLVKRLHQLDEIKPLHDYVKVDISLNGCPVGINHLEKSIDECLKGGKHAQKF